MTIPASAAAPKEWHTCEVTAEDFVASTYNEKDRKDYVYVSPALGGKVVNAFMANDFWTSVKKVQTAGGIDMPLPSDHRPVVVDINF